MNARWEERDSEVDVSGEEEGGEEKNREKPEEEEEEEEEGGGRSFFSFAIRTIRRMSTNQNYLVS